MNNEEFRQWLDQVSVWYLSDETPTIWSRARPYVPKTPNKRNPDPDPIPEENLFPVINCFKKVDRPCEWCHNTCTSSKHYKRSIDGDHWRGTCKDCGEKRIFPHKKK